jgi:hypothetical protein
MLQFQLMKIKRQKDKLQKAHQDFQWRQKESSAMKGLGQGENKKRVI